MIRILVVDDHAVVREGVKRVFDKDPDMEAVGEAGSAEEMFEWLERSETDVILLDVSMPGNGFLETLQKLTREHADIPVLVLSAHPEERFALRAVRAGAKGYVTKDRDSGELIDAVREVHRGHLYLRSPLWADLVDELRHGDEKLPHERLSAREYDVFLMFCEGKSVKEIAHDLGLSSKTVSTHRTRILEKMSLRNNADLVRYAIEHDLID